MSEETENAEVGGESAAAISLALTGASRAEADAFLRDQRHHLHEQIRHLDLGIWEKRIGIALRLATLFVGLVVAAALGAMAWDAAHSKGLVIEPFSVPGDLAGRGLNGQVVASQMIGKLTAMTARESSRAAQSYANNWGDNIKVEIPETGVSIGELRDFLREWLGHDIRISGEVFRTATGISVTARAGGGDAGASFSGAETDLDALLQKAAEHIYEVTQPYRYANYLDRDYTPAGLDDRIAHATAIYNRLIAGDDLKERAWALNGLGTIAFNFHRDDRESTDYYRRANAVLPDFTIGIFALTSREVFLGHNQSALANARRAKALLARDPVPDLNPNYVPNARFSADAFIAEFTGDYLTSVQGMKAGTELPYSFSVLSRTNFQTRILMQLGRLHDAHGVKTYVRESGYNFTANYGLRTHVYAALEDWPAVRAGEAETLRNGRTWATNPFLAYSSTPALLALARAGLGDFAGAEALIASTPGDCDDCLRVRAKIAEAEGNKARADYWFARVLTQSPSLPFGYHDLGRALLGRGKADDAIAQFTTANKFGPHFADPLEGWGEALMAKSQSHLAVAKFAAAEKYAPNWGRLQLKWGEALVYAGKRDEAAKHFARAAQLDLTPAEKAELARHS